MKNKKNQRKHKKATKEIAAINNSLIRVGQTVEDFELEKNLKIQGLKEELQVIEKDNDYITYFPLGEKYISLYANREMAEEALNKREELRKLVEKEKHRKEKFKKREMKMADKVIEDDAPVIPEEEKKVTKEENKYGDNFFLESDAEVEIDEFKRIVGKAGKIIKVEDPDRVKKHHQQKQDKYKDKDGFNKTNIRGKKPEKQIIKIKSRSYRVSHANVVLTAKKKVHKKF